MKIETLLNAIDLKAMARLEFQRGYVWNRDQGRGLIALRLELPKNLNCTRCEFQDWIESFAGCPRMVCCQFLRLETQSPVRAL